MRTGGHVATCIQDGPHVVPCSHTRHVPRISERAFDEEAYQAEWMITSSRPNVDAAVVRGCRIDETVKSFLDNCLAVLTKVVRRLLVEAGIRLRSEELLGGECPLHEQELCEATSLRDLPLMQVRGELGEVEARHTERKATESILEETRLVRQRLA